MKIITYLILEHGTPQAMTLEEFRTKGLPEEWDDWIWQDQPDKATAIARHNDALDAYMEDANSGKPIADTY